MAERADSERQMTGNQHRRVFMRMHAARFTRPFVAMVVVAAFATGASARAAADAADAAPPTTQNTIDRVDLMPNRPAPFKLKDFKAIARGCDKLLFDFDARGEYLPLIWWDDTKVNVPMRGFGFPSFVGRP